MSWLPKPEPAFGAFKDDRVEPSPDNAVTTGGCCCERNQMTWSDPLGAGAWEERWVADLDAFAVRRDGTGVFIRG